MLPAVNLNQVVRRFNSFTAVENLSLSVQPGEIFGVLGPNGAGKTTTIKMICGLLRRNAGEISVLGFDPQKEARQVRRRIGLVPQETNVYLNLNALENLRHHAALFCEDLNGLEKKMQDLLEMMSLWERRKDALHTYSGGMKRRLALARSLLHDPQIIFFDEPTLGVDVQGKHVLWEHIRQQKEAGKTFLVSTNDMSEAEALCDRLVIIDHGKAITSGTPEDLKSALGRDIISLKTSQKIKNPQEVFAGLEINSFTSPEERLLRFEIRDGEKHIAAILERISSTFGLESIRVARPSLDDVFLAHTGRALRE